MSRLQLGLVLALIGVVASTAPAGASNAALRGEIYSLRVRVDRASALDAERRTFLLGRLYDDDVGLDPAMKPDWMPQADFDDFNARVLSIDRALVDSALQGPTGAVGAIRGNGGFWMRSNVDGAWQPVALYVPPGYDGSHPVSLIVYLHGKGEPENRATARKILRDLADRCACIVAAPYARGQTQYADPAPADIYQLRDQMLDQFAVDRARVYLVGYSMGGFGVFEVGRYHPERWTAFLAIAGGLTGDDRDDVARAFPGKRVYMVSGTKDEDIPNSHIRKSVSELRAHGIETKYYEVPGATHYLYTMVSAIDQAWRDMLAGVPGTLEPLHSDFQFEQWRPSSAPAGGPGQRT